MSTETEKIIEKLKRHVSACRAWLNSCKKCTLVFHDDADGISSAAITKTALERMGIEVSLVCLEKLYHEAVENVHKKSAAVVYCDLGSPHIDVISKFTQRYTIILDHHDPIKRGVSNPEQAIRYTERVFDFNLEHLGLKGERDFSASMCCYLFARILNERNTDLSYISLIGAQELRERTLLYEEVLRESIASGEVKANKGITLLRLGMSVSKAFSLLQTLGSVGYYKNGPRLGVEACVRGFDERVLRLARELEVKRRKANAEVLEKIKRSGFNETKHIQYFDAGDTFSGMGSKVIGTLCSYLSYQRFVHPFKYIMGMMNLSREIPGLGKVKKNYVKVSVRVTKRMREYIDKNKMPPCVEILTHACRGIGIADGHAYAASCVVERDKKALFLERCERFIESSGKL